MNAPVGLSSTDGRLYVSNMDSSTANASIALQSGEVFSEMGFVEPYRAHYTYGLVASHVVGQSSWTARLFSLSDDDDSDSSSSGPAQPLEFCKQTLAGAVPTVGVPATNDYGAVILASNDGSKSYFSFVNTQQPSLLSTEQAERRARAHKRSVLGTCPATSFGYPPTCSGCNPPQAVCGTTLQCAGGCCFVFEGKVTCCSDAPARFGKAVSC